MTKSEMTKRAKKAKQMQKLQQQALSRAVEQAKKKQDDWVMVKHASAIDMIKDAIKRKGGKRKTRKPKRRHRRKTRKRRKRRVKRRRRTKRR